MAYKHKTQVGSIKLMNRRVVMVMLILGFRLHLIQDSNIVINSIRIHFHTLSSYSKTYIS